MSIRSLTRFFCPVRKENHQELLNETSCEEDIITEAKTMRQLYPDSKFPLEVLCEFLLEKLIGKVHNYVTMVLEQ